MTAKEYLGQAYHIDKRIESKLMQVESLRCLASKVTAVFNDMPHSSTPDNHKLEKTIAKIVDLEKEIDEDIDNLIDLKREINEVIKSIDDARHKTILEMRYLSFQTWEKIAVELGCDARHAKRLHGQALKNLKISEKCPEMSLNVTIDL